MCNTRIWNVFFRHSRNTARKVCIVTILLLQPRVSVLSVGVGYVIEKLGRCNGVRHGATQSVPEELMR